MHYDCSHLWAKANVNRTMIGHFFDKILLGTDLNFKDLPAPIFLAFGRFDYLIPMALCREAFDFFPNMSCHIFERSGHYPHQEQPEEFEEHLNQFFNDYDLIYDHANNGIVSLRAKL